jgi:mono/diheme cytochrome c family protein
MKDRGRRIFRVIALLIGIGILGSAAFLFWPAPAAPSIAAPPASAALVARGRYIATAADCVACHTVEGGQEYAGGRAFKLPFGTIYAPNITPDRDTGIGAWTDGQFVRAVRQGIGEHGEDLYPAFTYTSYAGMQVEDVVALKAYLMTLPAVRAKAPSNTLAFPFNQRRLMRFWKLLFLPRPGWKDDPGQPPEWNRGHYLITALGHCGECHTPRNLAYGMKSGSFLAGETMAGWTAWNITPSRGRGIGSWSEDDIVRYLRSGYAPGHAVAGGPMKEAVDYSLSKLSERDLRAMAVYLRSIKAKEHGPSLEDQGAALRGSGFTRPASLAGPADGRRIFEGACASCHGWNGQGQQSPVAALVGRRSVLDPEATNVIQTVLHGGSVRTEHGRAFMPGFAEAYSDAEIAAVSNYVVSHFGGQTGKATPKRVAEARRQ